MLVVFIKTLIPFKLRYFSHYFKDIFFFQSSIDYLVKFATEKHVNRKKKADKKEQKGFVLKRPIICICNDIYVPALKNLRQSAFVLNFPQTSSVRYVLLLKVLKL